MAPPCQGIADRWPTSALGGVGLPVTGRVALGTNEIPLRVLTVMPGLTPEAGAETSLAAVAPWLVEHGVELHLALLTPVRTLAPQLEAIGVTLHDLSGSRRFIHRVRALRTLMRELRPDVVHATLHEAATPTQVAALIARYRVLVTWANTPVRAGENQRIGAVKRAGVRVIEMVLAVVARTRFHAVTAGVARVKQRELFVAARRVRVAERGRDPALFAPRPAAEIAAARRELGLGDGDRALLTVGRQDLTKGHARLLDAFDVVAETHLDAVLLIAGREGSATAELQRRHRLMVHGDRVRILGHRDDIALLLQVATVAVCSSVREGAAGALIEAMASGTPIVSTRLDGLDGVLTEGINAVVVEPDRLAEGINRVFDDPGAAAHRTEQARGDFEARFTVERSARALRDVYEWAAYS